ncbi:MAG TPA: hypothetical protein VL990_16165 [Acidobacteriaceae bacterium]|nr:hypothetical protein [Acidobacteriaceae bacterium]
MQSPRYNPPQRIMMKKCWAVALALMACLTPSAHAANWEKPAADLARQIAALTGPGPAKLTVRNNSSLAVTEIPAIRQLLARDLRSLGVLTGGSDSATLIRVTLSENEQGGLWVAEVVEGTETRVTMLPVSLGAAAAGPGGSGLVVRRTLMIAAPDPILDAQVFTVGTLARLVVLEPERIVTYVRSASALAFSAAPEGAGWVPDQQFAIAHTRAYPRDMRGELVAAQDHLFDAFLPGVMCSGTNTGARIAVTCADSDDPWPVSGSGVGSATGPSAGIPQRAFYNAMRDSFTGVLAPGFGMDLPPFYQASDMARPTGTGLLLNTVDGRLLLIENNTLAPVAGANDWGSDFAVVHSACGSGEQVLVSGSGSASDGDSLRAWEIAGREAIAVSPPLPVDGAVMAIHRVTGGASATVIVRREAPPRYEVWNATALCN